MEFPFSEESIEHVLKNSRIYVYELEGAQGMETTSAYHMKSRKRL
jgi:hypothetical protein